MCYRNIKESLFRLASSDRCPQSFIFYGRNISEIEKISKEFSLKILGLESDNPRDILEFGINEKGISVEDIRSINFEMLKMPDESKNKVVIIHNADRMSIKAQNTFLKSLEDCVGVFVILIVRNIYKIISTVISRCLIIRFRLMDEQEYIKYLSKLHKFDMNQLCDLYLQSCGDVDVSISILDKKIVYEAYKHVIELLQFIIDGKIINVFEFGTRIISYKEEVNIFFEVFFNILRDINLYLETSNSILFKNKLFEDDIIKICNNICSGFFYYILSELYKFRNKVESGMNIEICYKNFILKTVEAYNIEESNWGKI